MAEQYENGSNLLIRINGKNVGHCTSNTVTFNTETKDRNVKPAADKGRLQALWKGKGVTGLSISIQAEGLHVIDETEGGYSVLAPLWGKGETVEVIYYDRPADGGYGENDTAPKPTLKGQFVITSMEVQAPAQDDVTYSVQLENVGAPEIYPGMEAK